MKLLIIEDNHSLRTMLSRFLRNEGYEVTEASTGEMGVELFIKHPFDLVLLDIMLPGIDGFEVCRKLRELSMIPIIMITAKSEDHDKILGLDVGADDYMVKPFSHQEVTARIRAIMRRIDPQKNRPAKYNGLEVDAEQYKISLFGKSIHVTKKEFEVLYHFIQHPNQLFTRDHLLDSVWGIDYYGDFRTVDSHIKRLREKLKTDEKLNWQIKTVWGKGYLFEVTDT
ncbi:MULTISPECIES: response regulator transcription factor [Vagococcus]|uniref:Phosphate regulon transcriptional regulatory protein PhoB (SphR) n=1 Tax=Vagococcus fluvialis bH819 TaxID=1255619 RepID=A0A1X6WKC5_9ENTE|nr:MULTISPECIES: response regulator transcription factor [Vagococcus]SLM84699.1 Phosphate regulon transcriptional regulatory protein PhoB (SphR) [Vagococcus fluvialis bH819]HCM89838.1 DNA-binding response regulator [Vagococcus sp.]